MHRIAAALLERETIDAEAGGEFRCTVQRFVHEGAEQCVQFDGFGIGWNRFAFRRRVAANAKRSDRGSGQQHGAAVDHDHPRECSTRFMRTAERCRKQSRR